MDKSVQTMGTKNRKIIKKILNQGGALELTMSGGALELEKFKINKRAFVLSPVLLWKELFRKRIGTVGTKFMERMEY